jgi:hypothetical protein
VSDSAFDDRAKGRALWGRPEFDRFAKGRLIEKGARDRHRAGRASQRASQGAPGSEPGGHEAVIKVVSWGKSSRSALATARYITRTRPKDAPEAALSARTSDGLEIAPEDMKAYLETWGLIPDARNLSAEAQGLSANERLQMPERDRFDRRQIGHMIMSIPAVAGATADQVEAISQDTLEEAFARRGIEYIYVVHTDHSARPHAHVMFRVTLAEPGGNKRQLRMGPEDLRVIRQTFAEKGRDQGVNLVATAREDRKQLAPALAQGIEQARPNRRYIDAKTREDQDAPWLAVRAPVFHSRHGAAYQQRFLGAEQTSSLPPPPAIELPALPKKTDRLIEQACTSFADPVAAKRNFTELYAEAPQFALWALNNRPEVVGTVAPGAKAPRLYLRQKDTGPVREPFEASPERVAELDRRMQMTYGRGWKERMAGEIQGSDALSRLPIVNAERQHQKAIARDPQFSQADSAEPTLKAWRDKARQALSAAPQEPRPIAAARASAERAARAAVTHQRRVKRTENNNALLQRAVDRFGALPGLPRPAPTIGPLAAMPAPKEAPEKSLPGWFNRMFKREKPAAPAPTPAMPATQPTAARPAPDAPITPEVPRPVTQTQQPTQISPRRRQRDDDRGRE